MRNPFYPFSHFHSATESSVPPSPVMHYRRQGNPFSTLINPSTTKEALIAFVNKIIDVITTGPQAYSKINLNNPRDMGFRRVNNLITRLRVEIEKLLDAVDKVDEYKHREQIAFLLSAGILYKNSMRKALSRRIHQIVAKQMTYKHFVRSAQNIMQDYYKAHLPQRTIQQSAPRRMFSESDQIGIIASELEEFPVGNFALPEAATHAQVLKNYRAAALEAVKNYITRQLHGVGIEGSKRAVHFQLLLESLSPDALRSSVDLQKQLLILIGAMVLAHEGSLGATCLTYFKNGTSCSDDIMKEDFINLKNVFFISDGAMALINKSVGVTLPSLFDRFGQNSLFFLNQIKQAAMDYCAENTPEKTVHDAAGMARARHVIDEAARIVGLSSSSLQYDAMVRLFSAIVYASNSTRLKEKLIHYTGCNEPRPLYLLGDHAISSRALSAVTPAPKIGWAKFKEAVCNIIEKFQTLRMGTDHEKKVLNTDNLLNEFKKITLSEDAQYDFEKQHSAIQDFIALLASIVGPGMDDPEEYCQSSYLPRLSAAILFFTSVKKKTIAAWLDERCDSVSKNSVKTRFEYDEMGPYRSARPEPEMNAMPEWWVLNNALVEMKLFNNYEREVPKNQKNRFFALWVCAVVKQRLEVTLSDRMLLYINLTASQVDSMQLHYGFSDELCASTYDILLHEKSISFLSIPPDLRKNLKAAANGAGDENVATGYFNDAVEKAKDERDLILLANAVVLSQTLPQLSERVRQETQLDKFSLLYWRDYYKIKKTQCDDVLGELIDPIRDYDVLFVQLAKAFDAFIDSRVGNDEALSVARALRARLDMLKVSDHPRKLITYLAQCAVDCKGRLAEAVLDFIYPVDKKTLALSAATNKNIPAFLSKPFLTPLLISPRERTVDELKSKLGAELRDNLILAAERYLRSEKGGVTGTGNRRASNLLARLELIDVDTVTGKQQLLILLGAIVLKTPSLTNDLHDRVLVATGLSKKEVEQWVGEFLLEECKRTAIELAPPKISTAGLFAKKPLKSVKKAPPGIEMGNIQEAGSVRGSDLSLKFNTSIRKIHYTKDNKGYF